MYYPKVNGYVSLLVVAFVCLKLVRCGKAVNLVKEVALLDVIMGHLVSHSLHFLITQIVRIVSLVAKIIP